MKRRGWWLSTLAVVLVGGVVAQRAGWLPAAWGKGASGARRVRAAGRDGPGSAAFYYRQGQYRHWHDCFLQQ
jgi:hypothetical protein